MPDAAVELVWSGRGLFVRGADTRPHAVGTFPDRTFVAIRFRPGAAGDVLGLHGRDVADARVGISELWGRPEMERLESLLASATSARAAADVLEDAVTARVRQPPDAVVRALATTLEQERQTRVGTLAKRMGVSERQLLRRCVDALGFGPKMLDRIIRFQRFRRLASERSRGLVELALLAGYFDQAHLARDCLRLAGETPTAHRARLTPERPIRPRRDGDDVIWSVG